MGRPGFRALLAAQFLGAFNDNAFRAIVSLAALESAASSRHLLVAGAGAIFVLPYLLFSTHAGWLADRFSKRSVVVAAKSAEIGVMALAVPAIASGDPRFMLAVLFLLGAQSAFFSPARLGIIPELVPDKDLSRANGTMEMATFTAIIAGVVGGGLMAAWLGSSSIVPPMGLTGLACLGAWLSLRVPRVPACGAERPLRLNVAAEVIDDFRSLKGRRALLLTVLGVAWFWFLGMAFQLNVLVYARDLMGLGDAGVTALNACVSIGIGLGAFVAGRLSGDRVELGLVPLGSIGLGVFSLVLGLTHGSLLLTGAAHALLGLSAGFFIVPLDAYLQQTAGAAERGRVIAAANFLAFTGVIAGAGWIALTGGLLGWDPALVVAATGLLSIAATLYILKLLPDVLVRLLLWLLTHTLYRITVRGGENVPRRGGVLLVCNHISFVDAFLVGSSTQRFVRFLMYRPIYETPGIHSFAKLMGAIPVSPADGRKGVAASLEAAKEALLAGRAVCIFAEGSISRTGNLLPFRRGFESIAGGTGAPIVPVHLDGVWGSIFSYQGGRFLWKVPRRIPYPVTVTFGQPLPSDTPAWQVRQAVMELSADAFAERKRRQLPLHLGFIRTARRFPRRACIADSAGADLSFRRALAGSLALASALRTALGREEARLGIALPPCAAAALANVAAMMAGRVPINLNITLGEAALASCARRAGIRTVITSRALLERTGLAPESFGARVILVEDLAESIGRLPRLAWWGAAALLPARALGRLTARPSMDDLATIIYSSGSTAEPKGVMLTHHNIVSNVEGMQQIFDIAPDDRMIGVLPFFHSFGFTATLWLPLTNGFGVVYHVNPLDARMVGRLCASHRVTFLLATPTFLHGYIRKCRPEQLASLRYVVVGAEKLRESLASAFKQTFGIEPLEGYGATELSPAAAMSLPDVEEEGSRQVGHKPGSIGQPLPGVAARVVDPETFRDVPVGESGLLLIRGANVMKGYLDDPERTAEVLRDGWYVTGDIARFDRDGFLTLTDRLSRFAKIGGEMVPLGAVEDAVQKLLAEEDARCAAAAVPDAARGERLVVLHTSVSLDPAECRSRLAQAGLTPLWIPRRESFHRVEEIPSLGTGKADLKRIKEMAAILEKQAEPA
ncbi:MAG TPA: acyl-[ACP]--phospholipid O-acyltransferase [Candidatus Polarisedimenticolia bacterium]|nr:acyl-[ACP]--phospholipid O-acyltransferase [Candidatus Polarisedimenticolia bacterium]